MVKQLPHRYAETEQKKGNIAILGIRPKTMNPNPITINKTWRQ